MKKNYLYVLAALVIVSVLWLAFGYFNARAEAAKREKEYADRIDLTERCVKAVHLL